MFNNNIMRYMMSSFSFPVGFEWKDVTYCCVMKSGTEAMPISSFLSCIDYFSCLASLQTCPLPPIVQINLLTPLTFCLPVVTAHDGKVSL